jgi:hypothetical protein
MEKIKYFLEKELIDFDNFKYEIEKSDELTYVVFSSIFGEDTNKELTFKLLGDEKEVYLHSTTFGWKAVTKGNLNKFFWIELLK